MQSGNVKKFSVKSGFTLVEMLVVLAILALLLTLAAPKYFSSIDRAKEATLKQDLNTLRESIDKFYADNGRYPNSLKDLVEKKYIRDLPLDPITNSTETWQLLPPEPPLEGMVFDIKSGAEGLAKDGTAYADW
ncbi:PilE Tfp pilus assembly protein PilE [Methylophilaceae bacterium]|jgi:general secretion pathway protein G